MLALEILKKIYANNPDTRSQRNTRRININNKTGYRGVSLNRNKYKKYSAYICVDNKQIFLGTSSNSIECAKAYDKYITDNNLEHTKNFN